MSIFSKKNKPATKVEAKRNDKITFMFMSGPDHRVKDVSFTARGFKTGVVVFSICMVALGVAGTLFVQNYSKSLAQVWNLKKENQLLSETAESQASELQDLQYMAGNMLDKIATLESSSDEVREKVGLEKEGTENGNQAALSYEGMTVTRGLTAAVISTEGFEGDEYMGTDAGYEMDSLEDLKASMEAVNSQIDAQIESMSNLANDVDKELAKQDATPDYWPAEGRITSTFGWRKDPFGSGREYHNGIDIANKAGTPIYASAAGIVVWSGYKSGWGNVVIISHGNKYSTLYAHCSELLVDGEQEVKKGDLIAKMGSTGRSTGNHCHFGIQLEDEWIDPQSVLAVED